jgi:hypothetical protein
VSDAAHIAELEALHRELGKRIEAMKAEAEGSRPVVDREPPPEAFARAMARRRRKGRAG